MLLIKLICPALALALIGMYILFAYDLYTARDSKFPGFKETSSESVPICLPTNYYLMRSIRAGKKQCTNRRSPGISVASTGGRLSPSKGLCPEILLLLTPVVFLHQNVMAPEDAAKRLKAWRRSNMVGRLQPQQMAAYSPLIVKIGMLFDMKQTTH